jgi:hypothetical protein
MTDVLDLFKGIGVIIDDALNTRSGNQNDIIWKIKNSFEKQNIPILTFSELPENEQVQNFHSISFLLLDWDLYGQLPEEVSKPQTATDDNIEFINRFNSICFAPIFIFSNENTDDIKTKLTNANLYDANKSNHIFVESKSSLKQSRTLFGKIKKWIVATPSIYALKEWEKSLSQAKCDLFKDFYNINPNWPKVLQQAFTADGVDKNYELGTLIYKNLIARTTPTKFDEKILNKNIKNISKEDLRKVLECERYLKKEKLSDNPATGDVFIIHNKENNEMQYFVNIRPDCDIVRENNDVKLYCLRGRIVDEKKINTKKWKGNFDEKINNAFISFIDDGKIIEFLFGDIKIKKWNNIKNNRIGRLLPPYITRLQQKYSFYLQRQGLPAIPSKAIK